MYPACSPMYLRLQPYVPACNPMCLRNQALLLSLYPAGVDRSKPSEIAALIAALDARQVLGLGLGLG